MFMTWRFPCFRKSGLVAMENVKKCFFDGFVCIIAELFFKNIFDLFFWLSIKKMFFRLFFAAKGEKHPFDEKNVRRKRESFVFRDLCCVSKEFCRWRKLRGPLPFSTPHNRVNLFIPSPSPLPFILFSFLLKHLTLGFFHSTRLE